MGDGEAAQRQIGEQRLRVAQNGAALGGVAGMADGGGAGQAARHVGAREVLADEAQMPLVMEANSIEADDAAAFLTAVLKSVQAESRED